MERLVELPVFGEDGRVETTRGYHPGSRTYYWPPAGFVLPDLPPNPVEMVPVARTLVVDEVLRDFPFVTAADRAHAVAGLLLPFARGLFERPTPLHLISAPTRGTGKTLLARAIAFPAAGSTLAVQTEARDEEEWRKRIGAALSAGPSIILFDNLLGRLESAALAGVLTAEAWTDRRLGHNDQTIQYPNRALWLASADNLYLSDEMVRRTAPIYLDVHLERPYERAPGTFLHPNLLRWAAQTRSILVWAAITLVQAWVVEGRPLGSVTIGSFEAWAETMGGMLQVAGIDGFLANIGTFRDEFDAESAGRRGFITALWEAFGSAPFGAGQALRVYRAGEDFLDLETSRPVTDRSAEAIGGRHRPLCA